MDKTLSLFESGPVVRSAYLSECKKYRYFLSRTWDDNLPRVLFIMLNPSTADAETDDPTIRRCKNYAISWGYGGFYVINLFAYRSKLPTDLLQAEDPIGPENEIWFRRASKMASLIVCAWGNGTIIEKLRKIHHTKTYRPLSWLDLKPVCYLELSNDGTPKHPLYLLKTLTPQKYTLPRNLVPEPLPG
jgi:hypothetical protein